MRFTITENHETAQHKASGHTARSRWRQEHPAESRYDNAETRFIGVDGEGVNFECTQCECEIYTETGAGICRCLHAVGYHVHRYVLLGIGDKHISNTRGLSWEECFQFLWANFRTGSVAYVGFFLGYDFVQWFRSLPEERARMLLTEEGRRKRKPKSDKRPMPFPVYYKGWEFDMLGSKRFKLRKSGSKRWMNICDTGPFFQKSFLSVIDPKEWSDPVVSSEEYEQISRGKARRSSAVLDDDMRTYNARENEILARVLCRLNEGFQTLGIHLSPGQWFGPGQAASAWLDGRSVTAKELREIVPREILEHARESYYGGWFEIMAHGTVPGTTYEYDINSAYPHIISALPCLVHGEWVHRDYRTNWNTPYTLVYARVTGDNPYIGAMLHRDKDGNIYRPHETEGWYWQHELNAAVRAGIVDMERSTIHDWWTYRPCECEAPFQEVRNIYALRKKVGKKTPIGIACKLVPNSLYGKFAQSVGSPKYSNPVYASLITSGCRTMILNAIASHPEGAEDVLMVATDGIYFRSPNPNLKISGDLGDWDYDTKQNICLFKPGVYWDDKARTAVKSGNAPVFKARGISARDFGRQLDKVDKMFEIQRKSRQLAEWPVITFPVSFAVVSALQALQRGNWSLAGTVTPEPYSRQSSEPWKKRCKPYWEGNGTGKILRSAPRVNEPYEKSHPYEKRFGIDDPFSDESNEQYGITPDGLPGILLREALYEL